MYYEKTIKDFGAAGNGMTDDTAALQKALNSGETVFFPAGVYLVSDQLETKGRSVSWIGTGERSIIRLMPAETSRKSQSFRGMEVYDTRMILIKDAGSVTFRHLMLDANKEAFDTTPPHSRYDYTTCLEVWGAERVVLDDITARGGLIEGVYIDRTPNIRITNSRFIENGFYRDDASGIQISGVKEMSKIMISDCEFSHNGFNGLELNQVWGAVVNNIICSNNGFDGVALWGGSCECLFSNVFANNNRGGMNFRRNHSAGYLDIVQEGDRGFSAGIVVNGLVTEENEYGIMWGCARNILINGWIGDGDNFQHALCYLYPGEDITGEIRGARVFPDIDEIFNDVLIPADGEIFDKLGAVPYGDPYRFKVRSV